MGSVPISKAKPTTLPALRPGRVLSNLAAEFVEVRAGREICDRTTEVHDDHRESETANDGNATAVPLPKFIKTVDRFMTLEEAPDDARCYQESIETMRQFQETLQKFAKTLQSRKVFKNLNIEPRDPANYDLHYVLDIASSIHENKEGAENTRSIKSFAKKCFRGVNKHKTTLECLFSMVPNDIYGSAISGGFSLILAAIESHENERVKIQTALSSIPRKLRDVRRLTTVHIMSPELHHRADQLFVSIFHVLERIIDKLSDKGWTVKFRLSDGRHGDDIMEAIEAMGERVKEFQEEVDTCAQLRLGRIDEGVSKMIEAFGGFGRRLDDMESAATKDQESKSQVIEQVYNMLYRLCASNPNFDPANGTYRREIEMPPSTAIIDRRISGNAALSREKTDEFIDRWFSGLGAFDPMPEKQISECLTGLAGLDLDERDKVQWIIASEPLTAWLTSSESQILHIQAETAPFALVNALSFSAATLAFTLTKTTNFAVLSFFCGLRRNDSRENADSGPKAIYKSLNGQLLRYIQNKRQMADLSFLEQKKVMRLSRDRSKYAKQLFRELLGALDENDVVVVILDSFSRLGEVDADKGNGDEVIEELAKLIKELPQLVIKVLVTDAMPSCSIRELANLKLHVPDKVDGWRNDINMRTFDQQTVAIVEQFRSREEEGYSSSEEDDSSVPSSEEDSD